MASSNVCLNIVNGEGPITPSELAKYSAANYESKPLSLYIHVQSGCDCRLPCSQQDRCNCLLVSESLESHVIDGCGQRTIPSKGRESFASRFSPEQQFWIERLISFCLPPTNDSPAGTPTGCTASPTLATVQSLRVSSSPVCIFLSFRL